MNYKTQQALKRKQNAANTARERKQNLYLNTVIPNLIRQLQEPKEDLFVITPDGSSYFIKAKQRKGTTLLPEKSTISTSVPDVDLSIVRKQPNPPTAVAHPSNNRILGGLKRKFTLATTAISLILMLASCGKAVVTVTNTSYSANIRTATDSAFSEIADEIINEIDAKYNKEISIINDDKYFIEENRQKALKKCNTKRTEEIESINNSRLSPASPCELNDGSYYACKNDNGISHIFHRIGDQIVMTYAHDSMVENYTSNIENISLGTDANNIPLIHKGFVYVKKNAEGKLEYSTIVFLKKQNDLQVVIVFSTGDERITNLNSIIDQKNKKAYGFNAYPLSTCTATESISWITDKLRDYGNNAGKDTDEKMKDTDEGMYSVDAQPQQGLVELDKQD